MMIETLIAEVDRLLARDGCYRPLELLVRVHRLPASDRRAWQRGEIGYLEDALIGNPRRVLALLEAAADRARGLGLRCEPEPAGQGRYRHDATERLVGVAWQRAGGQPQGDLFMDSGAGSARRALEQALINGEAGNAEAALGELAGIEPGSDMQVDAEHLVDALAWLTAAPEDAATMLETLDRDIAPRAHRVLGARRAGEFMARFWQHLADHQDPAVFDPERAECHPAALAARRGEHETVIAAVEAVPDHWRHAALNQHHASAALALGRRQEGLQSVCQLCWRHPGQAVQWLERHCTDPVLEGHIERFWDLDEAFEIELFPAWLAAQGHPVAPAEPARHPETVPAKAFTHLQSLRQDPNDVAAREWLKEEVAGFFEYWMKG